MINNKYGKNVTERKCFGISNDMGQKTKTTENEKQIIFSLFLLANVIWEQN